MKVLLLSVALLFFTGAQGRHFWQQDEPKQEESEEKALERILHDSLGIVTDLIASLDYSSMAKEYQLKEKLDAARKHMDKWEKAVDSYFEGLYKKLDEELHEKFPVFRTKVYPMLKDFDNKIEEQIEKIAKKVIPVASDLLTGISSNVVTFFESLESVAVDSRDKLREEMDKLRARVQPYVDDVHAEYKRYHSNLQGEFQKDMKELKQDVEKNIEKLKEQAMPHIEQIKSKFPDGKDFQEKVEQFFKELKEALSKDE